MTYERMSKLAFEAADEIVRDNPKFAAAVNKAGPTVIGAAVGAATGIPNAGIGANVAAGIVSGAEPDGFAKAVTVVGVVAAAQAAAIVAVPVLAVVGVFWGIGKLFDSE